MPQKPLLKAGKKIDKKKAANNHGKGSVQRKGKFEKPPKKGIELERYKDNKELSRNINATNENNFAAIAQNKGGRLKTLKNAKLPALAPKDMAIKAKTAAQRKAAAANNNDDDEMDEDDESS